WACAPPLTCGHAWWNGTITGPGRGPDGPERTHRRRRTGPAGRTVRAGGRPVAGPGCRRVGRLLLRPLPPVAVLRGETRREPRVVRRARAPHRRPGAGTGLRTRPQRAVPGGPRLRRGRGRPLPDSPRLGP